MGKRGPKKLPTTIKVARGTHRGDPEAEVQPVVGDLTRPEGLGEAGRRFWDRQAPIAHRNGLLTEADVEAFERLCRLHDREAAYQAAVDKDGITVVGGTGGLKPHPLLPHLAKVHDEIVRLLSMFGFSPSDRSGLQVEKPQKSVATRSRA